MDRLSPRHRPTGRNAGTQQWRNLLFLHWPVPLETLRPLIPGALDIDTHEGTAWIGLVPFEMEGVRTNWMPQWTSLRFLETNLRTYVHHKGTGPGVWFFSLEAASWLAVQVARLVWSLPYYHARMIVQQDGERFDYTTTRRKGARPGGRGAHLEVSYEVGEALPPPEPGTQDFFFLERYLLYSERRGRLYRGQVNHRPYPVHSARIERLDERLIAAAGMDRPHVAPIAHWSPGVDVEVFALQPIGSTTPALVSGQVP